MALMTPAARAMIFCAFYHQFEIRLCFNGTFNDVKKAGPASARLVIRCGLEKRETAAHAVVNTSLLDVPVFTREWAFRPGFESDIELRGSELGPPLFGRLYHLVQADYWFIHERSSCWGDCLIRTHGRSLDRLRLSQTVASREAGERDQTKYECILPVYRHHAVPPWEQTSLWAKELRTDRAPQGIILEHPCGK